MKVKRVVKVNIACAALFSVFGFTALCSQAMGQGYPVKPVRIVVPFAPGGGTDITARFISQRLSDALGKAVIVENKPGAGGVIGIESGMKSPPDGYTLVMVSASYTVNPGLYKLSFDPVEDITPLALVSRGPQLVAVNPGVPVKSIKELIALAKQKPGAITFASAGQGSHTHMAAELLCLTAGIKMTHVPYKGTGPALTDTIAGQTQVFVSNPLALLPHIKAGRLRVIAVTSAKRSAALPDVPTVAEAGFPGFDVMNWHGLIAPKGLSGSVADRLNAEVNRILRLKETADHLQADGQEPAGGTPAQFRSLIGEEIAVWRKVIADAGVRAE